MHIHESTEGSGQLRNTTSLDSHVSAVVNRRKAKFQF